MFTSNFEIYSSDWVLLISFLRNGYLPASYDIEKNISDLNYCYNTTIKLGGIPEFETYYNYYFDYNENMKSITYNPMTPQEDISNVYSWRVISMFSLLSNELISPIMILDKSFASLAFSIHSSKNVARFLDEEII